MSATAGSSDGGAAQRPALRIVRGEPSAEELAALTAVLAAASSGPAAGADPEPPSGWASREALVRRPGTPGPGAWRSSARPS